MFVSMNGRRRSFLILFISVLVLVFYAPSTKARIIVEWVPTLKVEFIQDIQPGTMGSEPEGLCVFNNALYFSAYDSIHGRELWKFDGNVASLVADIMPGNAGGIGQFGKMMPFNGALYFTADDGVHGAELWRYDGNVVSLVADINQGPSHSNPQNFKVYAGVLYFSAFSAQFGCEMWRYDGNSLSLVSDLWPGGQWGACPSRSTIFNGELYFIGNDGVSGKDVWKFDGNTISHAIDVGQNFQANYNSALTVFNEELYIFLPPECGVDLCKYNGTPNPIHLPISPAKRPMLPIVYNGALYFDAEDDVHGVELWKFDGNSASLVVDIAPGPEASWPSHKAIFKNKLFYSAFAPSHGSELFRGISLIKDINPGWRFSSPSYLTAFKQALYFSADDGVHGPELMRFVDFGRQLKMHVELRLPYKKPWEWPVYQESVANPLAGTAGFLVLSLNTKPRLLARRNIRFDTPGNEIRPLYSASPFVTRQLPAEMALVSVLLHDASNRLVASETKFFALNERLDPKVQNRLKQKARTFIKNLTVRELREMKMRPYRTVR